MGLNDTAAILLPPVYIEITSASLTQHSCKAKITYFDYTVSAHKNVFRFYVSMYHLIKEERGARQRERKRRL